MCKYYNGGCWIQKIQETYKDDENIMKIYNLASDFQQVINDIYCLYDKLWDMNIGLKEIRLLDKYICSFSSYFRNLGDEISAILIQDDYWMKLFYRTCFNKYIFKNNNFNSRPKIKKHFNDLDYSVCTEIIDVIKKYNKVCIDICNYGELFNWRGSCLIDAKKTLKKLERQNNQIYKLLNIDDKYRKIIGDLIPQDLYKENGIKNIITSFLSYQ